MLRRLKTIGLMMLMACNPQNKHDDVKRENAPAGMVFIPGGEFIMGTDDPEAPPHEHPAHRVQVHAFWMDETEVTNAQFDAFVKATKYVTVAERPLVWEELQKELPSGTPPMADSLLRAGTIIFNPPDHPVLLNDISQWWQWKVGANWKAPEGPGTDLHGRWDHPVIHIAYEDAEAYARWANKRLPTEAEWEFASSVERKQPNAANSVLANTFQGSFPFKDLGEDGFAGTAPVKSFPANSFGLYDMIGNVWEWTQDWYDPRYFKELTHAAVTKDPNGPVQSFDPAEPYIPKRVTKGGSFLCSSNYCSNYRTSARQGSAVDSGQSHIGFRCVLTKE
ncbi:formylglycine-generating enzyme family protein [Chryseolinea lacunae]|uniref:Formylglycine-generating enzyme family protein n=1 Tax=Chryseolinea lacunae TaxID=2801331 RepID=A0ABS1L4G8_9BACT|nr:formylglycine-generating enzyme family protein [Chryseolinea lacunae]MBL0745807.1 formylglycine-generating enzyme family protein [Chryseolinea lacunae]